SHGEGSPQPRKGIIMNVTKPNLEQGPRRRFFKRAAIATLIGGIAAGIGFKAFGQGGGSCGWHRGGFMAGPLDPAQVDEHLDRMLKHLYVEIDATEEQKQKLAPIVKQAAKDLLPFRERIREARGKALELLTQDSVDRTAIEALRAEHLQLAEMVSEYLGEAGFRVSIAAAGRAGLERLAREPFDALVLDLMLPDMDGLDVCREVRAKSDTPVLMLTARGDAADRIVGLELGADDYLPKPFQPRELLARLRAILRRGKSRGRSAPLRFGSLEIDRDSRSVRVDGQERSLTGYQFALLVALAEHAGRVL